MLSFDPAKYQETLRLAGNAWRNADGKADDFGRSAVAALINDDFSPLALAISVYDEMKPTTARGALAEPKESDRAPGGVSVSSLRSARGGEGARSCMEAIFYVADNRGLDLPAVTAFVLGEKDAHKLFPLQKHLAKVKADTARRVAADKMASAGGDDLPEREGDQAPSASESQNPAYSILAMAEHVASLIGDDLLAHADAIALLLDACRGATSRLAAADIMERQAA